MTEDLMPRVWNLLASNPALVVPLALAGIVNVLAFVSIGFLCVSQIMSALQQMSWAGPDVFLAALPAFAVRSFSYAVVMGLLFLFARSAVLCIHGAGWGLMMSRAAAGGRASLSDYLEGIGSFTPRVVWAWVLQRCLFALPVLALAALAAGVSALGLGAGVTAGLLLLGVPVVLLAEGVILLGSWMWRPACFTDDLPVVEAFRRSAQFARKRFGHMLLAFAAWGVFLALALGVNAFLRLLFSLLFDAPAFSSFRIVAGIDVTLILWAVAALGTLYYLLYFNVLYVEDLKISKEIPTPPNENAHV